MASIYKLMLRKASSFSGIYYFSLLTIIGMGTVTSSLFVALERRVRYKNVPWFLYWLSWHPREMKTGYKLSRTEPVSYEVKLVRCDVRQLFCFVELACAFAVDSLKRK